MPPSRLFKDSAFPPPSPFSSISQTPLDQPHQHTNMLMSRFYARATTLQPCDSGLASLALWTQVGSPVRGEWTKLSSWRCCEENMKKYSWKCLVQYLEHSMKWIATSIFTIISSFPHCLSRLGYSGDQDILATPQALGEYYSACAFCFSISFLFKMTHFCTINQQLLINILTKCIASPRHFFWEESPSKVVFAKVWCNKHGGCILEGHINL